MSIVTNLREIDVRTRWIEGELCNLWHDLLKEHRWTLGNEGVAQRSRPWSVACEHLAERIKSATALVGPADWRMAIGMDAIIDGWFVWANRKLGIENPILPTEQDIAQCIAMRQQHHP